MGRFLYSMLGSLSNLGKAMGKAAITDIVISLDKDVLPGLVSSKASNATSNVVHKLGRKISGKGAVRAGLTLFISNKDINDIFKIIKSLEKSGLLNDGATETVKKWDKKQVGEFLRAIMTLMAASITAPVPPSLIML